MKNKKIAFIGLGKMGYPMAGHLSQKGFDVFVFNRTKHKSISWLNEFNGTVSNTLNEAVQDAEFICLCVGDDKDVIQIIYDVDGILASIEKGAVLIDHTTASAELARRISKTAKEQGFNFLDAPISGGEEGAKKAKLSIMVGGEKDTFEKSLQVMQAYATNVNHMGENGAGQLTKMVNQICIVANLCGIAEAFHFGLNEGLDMNKVISIISKGAAQSWQLENRGPWMLSERYKTGGFSVDLIYKDLCLIAKETFNKKTELPITEKIKGYFKQLKTTGRGDWDFSAIITLLRGRN